MFAIFSIYGNTAFLNLRVNFCEYFRVNYCIITYSVILNTAQRFKKNIQN